MQEAAQESPADNVKMTELWERLNPLQKDMYKFLSTNKGKKALCIAKAVKKQCAADVNPDLYKMKSLNLVHHDDSKHWFIKLQESADNDRSSGKKWTEVATQYPSGTETEKINKLPEQQAKIYSFLLSVNTPQRAIAIAKGIGRKSAKDVNPDLYSLKKLDLVLHNEQEHFWAIKHSTSAEATPSAAEYTVADGPNTTLPLTEEDNIQNWPNRRDQQITITRNYSIQINNCQNISIGDNSMSIIGDRENLDHAHAAEYEDFVGYADEMHVTKTTTTSGIGDDTIWTDVSNCHITEQERERQARQLTNSIQTDISNNDSSFLDTESDLMHQNPAALTSSPIISTHSTQIVTISDTWKGLADLTLDEQENRSTSCSSTSATNTAI